MAEAGRPGGHGGGRNESIEGLRGLAAFLVVVSHINGIAVERGFAPGWQRTLDSQILTHLGTFGVCAFFCISGYLIVQTLWKRGDVKRFAVNRAKRIYPLFLVLSVVAIPAAVLVRGDLAQFRGEPFALLTHAVSNLLFLPGVFDLPIAQKNAWSLSYELVFYATACLLFLGTARGRWGWGALGLVVAVLMLFLRPYAWFFLVGVAVYGWERRRAGFPSWLALGPVGLVALLATYLSQPRGWHGVPALNPATGQTSWEYTLASLWTWPVVLVCALVFFASVVSGRGWLSSVLSRPELVWLGTLSYSLYLVHPFVLQPLAMVQGRLGGLGPYVFIGVGLVFSILLSALSYRWVEVRLTERLFGSRPDHSRVAEAAQRTAGG